RLTGPAGGPLIADRDLARHVVESQEAVIDAVERVAGRRRVFRRLLREGRPCRASQTNGNGEPRGTHGDVLPFLWVGEPITRTAGAEPGQPPALLMTIPQCTHGPRARWKKSAF